MKRIFIPTRNGTDWQRLLAKPNLHWKVGASAMTAAACWEAAADRLPSEIAKLLNAASRLELADLQLLVALPEWHVDLPGGQTKSATDVLALCGNAQALCVIAVEAKVLEDFGPTLCEKQNQTSPGQKERIKFLHELLGVMKFSDSIRYQLVHRTASALLTARDFHASAAVMLVHAFDTPADRTEDFNAFAKEMEAEEVSSGVYWVKRFEAPRLYLAWCSGNASFRKIELPSAT